MYGYDDFEACLSTVDADYIALPNSLHAPFAIRAARAGVHVLCEKPLAVTVKECRKMIQACRTSRVKLMTAYRLHFDQATLEVVDLVRKGRYRHPQILQLVVCDDGSPRQYSDKTGNGRRHPL